MRAWRPSDAAALGPILAANVEHLAPWIPAHVATPAPVPELAERLARFAADFSTDRAYRYALLSLDGARLLGEADLFPRAAGARVPLAEADHAELGYWLDAAATGQGFATEAMRALLEVAESLPSITRIEIRCDVGNAPSAAVARRMAFRLERVEGGTEVWQLHVKRKT